MVITFCFAPWLPRGVGGPLDPQPLYTLLTLLATLPLDSNHFIFCFWIFKCWHVQCMIVQTCIRFIQCVAYNTALGHKLREKSCHFLICLSFRLVINSHWAKLIGVLKDSDYYFPWVSHRVSAIIVLCTFLSFFKERRNCTYDILGEPVKIHVQLCT